MSKRNKCFLPSQHVLDNSPLIRIHRLYFWQVSRFTLDRTTLNAMVHVNTHRVSSVKFESLITLIVS